MATVTLNRAGLNQLLVEPTGPVMQNMLQRAERVKTVAQSLVPVYMGDLRSSIRIALVRQPNRNAVDVGSDLRYAKHVEYGTQGGYRGNPALASPEFVQWAIDHDFDPFLLGLHIQQNGTRPHPYLRPALAAAA